MSTSIKVVLILVGLLFTGVATWYWNFQRQQQSLQFRILNGAFAKVQPRSEKVFFILSNRGMMIQLPGPVIGAYNPSALLSPGSGFKIQDEHFAVNYIVSQIASDGVTIDYSSEGGGPSPVGLSQGSVKLGWK